MESDPHTEHRGDAARPAVPADGDAERRLREHDVLRELAEVTARPKRPAAPGELPPGVADAPDLP